jgi:hydroxymethylbilane synthase
VPVREDGSVRLASRGSPLALWQARRVADLLGEIGVPSSLVIVETVGDRRLDVPLDRLGGQGIFVKEVQTAVTRGEADAAVHSAKDLPASEALGVPGLVIAAFPERADPRDVLIGGGIHTLATGSTVATGSARRRAQLANLRPDLTFAGLRGNLATRLAAVGSGDITAVVVAKAAIDRLGWTPPDGLAVEVLAPEVMLPQVGQGSLAVECRAADESTRSALAAIDDLSARPLIEAERAYLSELGGGCTLPVGAHACWSTSVPAGPGALSLTAMMASGDGIVVLRHTETGDEPEELGRRAARYLVDEAGGYDLGEWISSDAVAEPVGR